MDEKRKEHAQIQQTYFDERAAVFTLPIPDEVKERTRQIVESAQVSKNCHILDVGTGAGALIPFFLQAGAIENDIIGLDLSEVQLKTARQRYPSAQFICQDVLDYARNCTDYFEHIFFNACFGNLWNQEEAISTSQSVLSPQGRIVISHPMGKKFVARLHEHEPEIVPFLLPEKELLSSWCNKFALTLEKFVDEDLLYVAVLKKA